VIRLILIDDHNLIRQGLKILLTATDDIDVILDARSLAEALEQLSECDVILINQRHLLPPFLKTCQQLAPQAGLVVMSSADEEFLAVRLLSEGVLGYLDKQTSAPELLQAVRKAAKGLRHVPSQLAKQLTLNRITQPAKALIDNPFSHLAAREMTCTLLLAQGKSTAEIGQLMAVSTKTVNTYRHRIFQKLQVSGDVELIKLAYRHGLLEDLPSC